MLAMAKDDPMSIRALRYGYLSAWLGLILLCAYPLAPKAQTAPTGGVDITGLRLRKDEGRLNLHFLFSAPPSYQVVQNIARRVVVIKFANARAALPDGKTEFLFNDPMLEGVAFEVVSGKDLWAKIRLRGSNLAFAVGKPPSPEQMVIGFKVAPPSSIIEITSVVLSGAQGGALRQRLPHAVSR